MTLKELYAIIEDTNLRSEMANEEDFKNLLTALYSIVKKQNEVIFEFRNHFVRLNNCIDALEKKQHECSIYKKLCNIILDKIDKNPVSALWFLYSVRKKISQIEKDM